MNSNDKKDKSSAKDKGLCRFVHAGLYMCCKHIYHSYGTEEKPLLKGSLCRTLLPDVCNVNAVGKSRAV